MDASEPEESVQKLILTLKELDKAIANVKDGRSAEKTSKLAAEIESELGILNEKTDLPFSPPVPTTQQCQEVNNCQKSSETKGYHKN